MIYCCCLCAPGKIREGQIRDGYGVPLCAEHFSEELWFLRLAQPPTLAPLSPYLEAAGRALINGAA
jgi:hypothetical protein